MNVTSTVTHLLAGTGDLVGQDQPGLGHQLHRSWPLMSTGSVVIELELADRRVLAADGDRGRQDRDVVDAHAPRAGSPVSSGMTGSVA